MSSHKQAEMEKSISISPAHDNLPKDRRNPALTPPSLAMKMTTTTTATEAAVKTSPLQPRPSVTTWPTCQVLHHGALGEHSTALIARPAARRHIAINTSTHHRYKLIYREADIHDHTITTTYNFYGKEPTIKYPTATRLLESRYPPRPRPPCNLYKKSHHRQPTTAVAAAASINQNNLPNHQLTNRVRAPIYIPGRKAYLLWVGKPADERCPCLRAPFVLVSFRTTQRRGARDGWQLGPEFEGALRSITTTTTATTERHQLLASFTKI